jgi:hypothetical protein
VTLTPKTHRAHLHTPPSRTDPAAAALPGAAARRRRAAGAAARAAQRGPRPGRVARVVAAGGPLRLFAAGRLVWGGLGLGAPAGVPPHGRQARRAAVRRGGAAPPLPVGGGPLWLKSQIGKGGEGAARGRGAWNRSASFAVRDRQHTTRAAGRRTRHGVRCVMRCSEQGLRTLLTRHPPTIVIIVVVMGMCRTSSFSLSLLHRPPRAREGRLTCAGGTAQSSSAAKAQR